MKNLLKREFPEQKHETQDHRDTNRKLIYG